MAESGRLIDKFLALRDQLARLVMSIVPPKEVEDIVQETYVRVCQVENRHHIRDPRAYLFRTARNLALDHVKRSESRLTVSADLDALPEEALLSPPESDPTHAQVASDEEFALFCEAVRSLPRQCRRAFVLKKVYGYTLKEIMAEMDLGRPTVETHIVNGTKRCVQYLRERQVERVLPAERPSRGTNRHPAKGRREDA